MRVAIRRIRCRNCGASHQEPISFCPDPYARYTKWVAHWVLGLREEMSIKAVAKFTGLHWDTIKNIEKAWLQKKYRKVHLGEVEYLGIDEVYLGKVMGYITVVRDMDSGAVLFIGKGKGGDALKKFRKRLKRRQDNQDNKRRPFPDVNQNHSRHRCVLSRQPVQAGYPRQAQ